MFDWVLNMLSHSISLGTDSPLANNNPAIFESPLALKYLANPPDNSNVLHMFNNNTYTDFRTDHKHFLIPSYIISSDLIKPKCYKAKH